MRTTLNIDDDLLAEATARFPPRTPKTVIVEESLRRLLAAPPPTGALHLPDDMAALVARGVLLPPSRAGIPPQGSCAPLPVGTLLRDLAQDREDR